MFKKIIEWIKINKIFDLGLEQFEYYSLSKEEAKKILQELSCNDDKKCNKKFNINFDQYQFKKAFLYKQEGYNFLIFLLFRKGYLEVIFINLEAGMIFKDLKILENPSKLFNFIFNILYFYLLEKQYEIKIEFPTDRRGKIYLKMFEKAIKKYKLNYKVTLKNDYLLITPINKKLERLKKGIK